MHGVRDQLAIAVVVGHLASFPGLPHFFVPWFAFSIMHESGSAAKNGEGLRTLIT